MFSCTAPFEHLHLSQSTRHRSRVALQRNRRLYVWRARGSQRGIAATKTKASHRDTEITEKSGLSSKPSLCSQCLCGDRLPRLRRGGYGTRGGFGGIGSVKRYSYRRASIGSSLAAFLAG